MQGVHNYDILSNPYWAEKYQYIPCVYPQRYAYVISERKNKEDRKLSIDLVRLAIDLPYMDRKRAEKLEFNINYLKDEREKLKKLGIGRGESEPTPIE